MNVTGRHFFYFSYAPNRKRHKYFSLSNNRRIASILIHTLPSTHSIRLEHFLTRQSHHSVLRGINNRFFSFSHTICLLLHTIRCVVLLLSIHRNFRIASHRRQTHSKAKRNGQTKKVYFCALFFVNKIYQQQPHRTTEFSVCSHFDSREKFIKFFWFVSCVYYLCRTACLPHLLETPLEDSTLSIHPTYTTNILLLFFFYLVSLQQFENARTCAENSFGR